MLLKIMSKFPLYISLKKIFFQKGPHNFGAVSYTHPVKNALDPKVIHKIFDGSLTERRFPDTLQSLPCAYLTSL